MKKIVYLTFIITFALNLTSRYRIMNNRYALEFLYPEGQQAVLIHFENILRDFDYIFDEVLAFAEEHQKHIVQSMSFSDEEIHLYITNLDTLDSITLIHGEMPIGTEYLSNRPLERGSEFQSGQIEFPLTNWTLRIFNMEAVRNVGFSVLYLVDTTEEETIQFIEVMSPYGWGELVNNRFNWIRETFLSEPPYGQEQDFWAHFDSPLETALMFSYLLMFLIVVFFVVKERQSFLLKELWGYSKLEAFIDLPKKFIVFLASFLIISTSTISLSVVLLGQTYFYRSYLWYFWLSLVWSIVPFLLFLYIGLFLTISINNLAITMKGKSFYKRLSWSGLTTKIVLLVVLLFSLGRFIDNFGELRTELDALSYWKQSKDIFHTAGINILGAAANIEVPMLEEYLMELEPSEREELLERLENFEMSFGEYFTAPIRSLVEQRYRQFFLWAEENVDAFFMDSRDFLGYTLENPTFFNESFGQRDIWVSRNFFIENPIFDIYGVNVLESFANDAYTLDLLIPEFYRHLEADLKEYFLDDFYWRKVTVANTDNEVLRRPMIEISRDDLKVNIIFTKSNQNYFTYRRYTGNLQSMIVDPIVVIINPSINYTDIAALVSRAFFFRDVSGGQPTEITNPILHELELAERRFFLAVYPTGNQELVRLQWAMFQQTLTLVMKLSFSLFLSGVLIWAFYQLHAYKINLKYLFGYSYWERNSELIVSALTANILGLGLFIFFNGFNLQLIWLIIVIGLIDLGMIHVLGTYLTKTSVVKVLKGGEL